MQSKVTFLCAKVYGFVLQGGRICARCPFCAGVRQVPVMQGFSGLVHGQGAVLVLQGDGFVRLAAGATRRNGVAMPRRAGWRRPPPMLSAGKVTFLCVKAAKVTALCRAQGKALSRLPAAPRCGSVRQDAAQR